MCKKLKWFLLLCAICAASLFAACAKVVDLNGSAVVDLEIVTDAEDVEVFSSRGELSGEGNHYTVTVHPLNDFLITVGAKGYKTVNVPVTVADLASGRCEKKAILTEKNLVRVSMYVSGYGSNAKASCDGEELKRDGKYFEGTFESLRLEKGIVVSADGAETRTIFLTEEQLSAYYVNLPVYLVQSGKKLVEIETEQRDGVYGSFFFIDKTGKFVESTLLESFEEKKTWGVVLDKDYDGDITYTANYPNYMLNIDLPDEIPVYGCRTTMKLSLTYSIDLMNISAEEFEKYSGSFYAEAGDTLISVNGDFNRNEKVCHFFFSSNAPVSAIYLIDKENGNYLRVAAEYGVAYFDEATQGNIGNYAYAYDEDFASVILSDKIRRGSLTGEEIPLINGVFQFERGESYYVESYRSQGLFLPKYFRIDGKWCRVVEFSMETEFRLKLYYPDGRPVTGAVVKFASGSDTVLTETKTGIYSITSIGVFNSQFKITTSDGVYYVYADFSSADREADFQARTLTETAVLYENAGISLHVSAPIGGARVSLKTAGECNKTGSGNSYYLYVPQTGTLTLEIKYYEYDGEEYLPVSVEKSFDIEEIRKDENSIQIII